jgi:phage tail-like protein
MSIADVQLEPLEPDTGTALALAPDEPVSTYLQYLPAPFHADSFVGRYLMIVETIFSSIERTVDNVHYYFDPAVTPEEFLPWLASWVGVELDENMPVAKRRAAIALAGSLYRWQGTRRALREHLRAYAGRPPLIVENFDGMRLGQDAALGVNTQLGQPRPNTVAITVLVDRLEDVDEDVLRRIVEREKPAHVGYVLELRAQGQPRPAATSGLSGGNGAHPPDPDLPPAVAPPVAPWIVRQSMAPHTAPALQTAAP